MIDLLKPIVTSVQIDYSAELPDWLLQKIHDFTTGADVQVPGRGARAWRDDHPYVRDHRPYVPQLASMSFSGEMTTSPGWDQKLDRFINDSRLALCITSNFARNFDDEDLLALNKLRIVQISIDSSSPAAMEKLQGADLRTIIANVVRLRQAMLETRKKTELHFNCTVTRDNITHLGGLARLASLLQVDVLNIAEAGDSMPDTLEDLTDEEARLLALSVIDAVGALKDTATRISVGPGLKHKLAPVIEAISKGLPVSAAPFKPGADLGMRHSPCLQPWDTVIVHASGNVRLCRGPLEVVGDLQTDSLINLVNGHAARNLRATLLEGGGDPPCRACVFSTSDTPEIFLDKVRRAHEQYDAAMEPYQAFFPVGLNYDAEHGVKTQAQIFLSDLDPEEVGPAIEHANHYLPTAVADIDCILDAVPIAPERYTLVDLGCGMGRVLLQAAKRPFRQIVGVELSPALLDIAKKNLDAYNGQLRCRDIVLVRADAAEYTFPGGDILVYMYNPFTDVVLKPVLDRLSQHAGHVVIAYAGPIHGATIDAHPGFVGVGRIALTDPRQSVGFWQSRS